MGNNILNQQHHILFNQEVAWNGFTEPLSQQATSPATWPASQPASQASEQPARRRPPAVRTTLWLANAQAAQGRPFKGQENDLPKWGSEVWKPKCLNRFWRVNVVAVRQPCCLTFCKLMLPRKEWHNLNLKSTLHEGALRAPEPRAPCTNTSVSACCHGKKLKVQTRKLKP